MNVKELIEILKKHNPEDEVCLYNFHAAQHQTIGRVSRAFKNHTRTYKDFDYIVELT